MHLACGGAHTAAVTADGTLYMWGKNHNGQLGHGDVTSLDEPARVQSLGQRVAWVACGGSHTACLTWLGEGVSELDDRPRSSQEQPLSGRSSAASRYSEGSSSAGGASSRMSAGGASSRASSGRKQSVRAMGSSFRMKPA